MPGHHCGNNRGAHLRQNPVLLPSLVEELADEDQDNARIEGIDAIELARPGGIRKACLDELSVRCCDHTTMELVRMPSVNR